MSNYDSHIIGVFKDDLETVKEFLKIAINTIFLIVGKLIIIIFVKRVF